MKKHLFLFTFIANAATANAEAPLPPHLQTLYSAYPNLHTPLGHYADMQGFRAPTERIATILHELIHIDSAARGGYLIHGAAYDPYNQPSAWPAYRFSQFHESATRSQNANAKIATTTLIFRFYVANAPNNTLASLADELNAYGQSVAWLCQSLGAPTSPAALDERTKSVQSMRDMLRVTNLFLQTLRTEAPAQYRGLYAQQCPARNLLALTILNAIDSLSSCGSSLAPQDRYELDALTHRAKKDAAP